MSDLAGASNAIWATSFLAECLLLLTVGLRQHSREFALFVLYVCASLLQAIALFFVYRVLPKGSLEVWEIGWATQLVLMVARALAVTEICKNIFLRFHGVWELIRRILLYSAAVVLLYSVIVSRHNWAFIMPNIERGLNLAIATGLVGLFLFARYYKVSVSPVLRTLALGFLLYASFAVVNDTLLERYMKDYASLWSVLQLSFFLASVVIWTVALYQPHTVDEISPVLVSSDLYRTLAPEVNWKLRALNEQLSRFWKVEANRP